MRDYLLHNSWIFGAIGILIMVVIIHFRNIWFDTKFDDVVAIYALIVLTYGSVDLWTKFFEWLLK